MLLIPRDGEGSGSLVGLPGFEPRTSASRTQSGIFLEAQNLRKPLQLLVGALPLVALSYPYSRLDHARKMHETGSLR